MPKKKAIESEILDKLQAMNIIPGRWQREVSLPSPAMELELARRGIPMPQLAKVIGYRLDAVVTNRYVTIIEVKPVQSPAAIGQLLAYRDLYSHYKRVPKERIKLVHAFAATKPELDPLFRRHNIRLIHVPLT